MYYYTQTSIIIPLSLLVQVSIFGIQRFSCFLSFFFMLLLVLLKLNHFQGDTNNTLNRAVNPETCLFQDSYDYSYITKFPHFNVSHAMLKLI